MYTSCTAEWVYISVLGSAAILQAYMCILGHVRMYLWIGRMSVFVLTPQLNIHVYYLRAKILYYCVCCPL